MILALKQTFPAIFAVVFFLGAVPAQASEDGRLSGQGPVMGIPISSFLGGTATDDDICPEGTRVIRSFMSAWAVEDYNTMFSLLHDPESFGYTLQEAIMDFQFMEYKPYEISTVRVAGDDFEFLMSYGDWRHGDKEVKKIIVSGDSFKIMIQRNRSIFKGSLGSHF